MTSGRSSSEMTSTEETRASGFASNTKCRSTPPKAFSRLSRVNSWSVGPGPARCGSAEPRGHRSPARCRGCGSDQDHAALVAQPAQKGDDGFLGRHVDAGEGFVQKNDPASWARARARKTRFFWPPESSPIWRLRKAYMPTRSSAASTVSRSWRRGGAENPYGHSGPSSRRLRPEPGSSSRHPRSEAHRRRDCS